VREHLQGSLFQPLATQLSFFTKRDLDGRAGLPAEPGSDRLQVVLSQAPVEPPSFLVLSTEAEFGKNIRQPRYTKRWPQPIARNSSKLPNGHHPLIPLLLLREGD
jgi:hypothetical protein